MCLLLRGTESERKGVDCPDVTKTIYDIYYVDSVISNLECESSRLLSFAFVLDCMAEYSDLPPTAALSQSSSPFVDALSPAPTLPSPVSGGEPGVPQSECSPTIGETIARSNSPCTPSPLRKPFRLNLPRNHPLFGQYFISAYYDSDEVESSGSSPSSLGPIDGATSPLQTSEHIANETPLSVRESCRSVSPCWHPAGDHSDASGYETGDTPSPQSERAPSRRRSRRAILHLAPDDFDEPLILDMVSGG
jgi:hypothetical protein